MGSLKSKDRSIGIEVFRGRLRLRLPRHLFGGKQKAIYTAFPDTREGWKYATQKAWEIEDDLIAGSFDFTLTKYKLSIKAGNISKSALNLLDLWDKYAEYRRSQVSITHFQENYQKRYRNAILDLPTTALSDAIAIRDYLIKHKSPGTAKQLLVQFNAACKFGIKSKLLVDNPFEGMALDIKSNPRYADIDPFSVAERDAIIAAFEQHPQHYHYASFVKFLFLTGCRTSEAVGLRWGDINAQCTLISFSSAISKNIRKLPKTNKSRKFPISDKLQAYLTSIQPHSNNNEDLVFKNHAGNVIDPTYFITNVWGGKKGIVTQLVQLGKVERYRPQYNTRHTFITMCLEEGISIPQIARWVGNSPSTLLAHYGGVIQRSTPPEF